MMKVRNILPMIFVFILIFSSFSITFVPESQSSEIKYKGMENETDITPDQYLSTMYVLVNSSIYDSLEDELTTYKNNVQDLKDIDVQIIENSYNDPKEIREFLIDGYENHNLKGTFFVGNLPYAEYEIPDDFEGYCRFPIDHYYTDLDGSWNDSDGNGVYDEHRSGDGDLEPEIWFGRICMKTDWEEEIDLYENYFRKLHEYRTGSLSLPHWGLTYVDDDWYEYTHEYTRGIKELYFHTNVYNNKNTTNAEDYRRKLQKGYEWIQIHCHANHSARRHAFKINDGPKGSGGNFTSRDLYEDGQKSLFANIFTCGSANYTVPNYLCGWYALTEDYGLANVGTTKPGSMLNFIDYYKPLSEGKSLGEAMKEWWVENAEKSRSWFYGMTTIGDPTLSPTLEIEEKTYHYSIDIDGNKEFDEFAQRMGLPGDGTQDDPYIIDGYVFSGSNFINCISIHNTNVHFKISNNTISDAHEIGIYLENVRNGIITDNKVSNNSEGIRVTRSSGIVISDNHFESNDEYHIRLYRSIDNVIKNNTMLNHGIFIDGDKLEHWNTHSIDKNNTVNGKPLCYLTDENDITVPDSAGQVIIANCTNVIVKDLQMEENNIGVAVSFSSDISIRNNIISENRDLGLWLFKSNNCTLSNNSLKHIDDSGMFLSSSNDNLIQNNDMTHNGMYGLLSFGSSGNVVNDNNASYNHIGFNIDSHSDNNTLIRNTVSRNEICGIKVAYSSNYNTIQNNTVSKNDQWGIFIHHSEKNLIFHNNFFENNDQAYEYKGNNTWYNPTLKEGNFWGDYDGQDSDEDGIGDRPYQNISEMNEDRYPLMDLWAINEPPEKPRYPQPENGTDELNLNTVLAVVVSDPDGDRMDVSFYDASDDELIDKVTDVKDGNRADITWSDLSGETTYGWYVIVDDGEFTVRSDTWSFTTRKPKDNTPPTAHAGEEKIVKIGENFTLDASGSSDDVGIVSYVWELGDGRVMTGEKIYLEYQETGIYTVELTVTDEAGNTDSDTVEIKVERTRGNTLSTMVLSLLFSISLIALYKYKKK